MKVILLLTCCSWMATCFQPIPITSTPSSLVSQLSAEQEINHEQQQQTEKKKDNKAMSFLKKIGRVGRRQDFTHALGVDEGSAGKASMSSTSTTLRKSPASYKSCQETGLIDDCAETFPLTSMGTSWSGYTDQVMGGQSTGLLTREGDFYGRVANVLRGSVKNLPGQRDKFGFVQMATNLLNLQGLDGIDQSVTAVDASAYDGVELDVLYEPQETSNNSPENFNVHFKTDACRAPQASYRATFDVTNGGVWQTIRVPWSQFQGHGPGAAETPFTPTRLIRAGIVAIGKEYPSLVLGISGLRFYKQ